MTTNNMRRDPLTQTRACDALCAHHSEVRDLHLRDLFASDPARFSRFSLEAAGLLLDYSKNRIDERTMQLLCALARERGVEQRREAMFAGEKINATEQRAVLHTALRAPQDAAPAAAAPGAAALTVDGQNVSKEVHAVLAHIREFTERVREGAWLGHTGKPITDVVNIGIGGSDLGPKMVVRALRPFVHPRLSMHFVSNVDGHDLDAVLSKLNAETTLFVIASKTFTTRETMMNAQSARAWFLQSLKAGGGSGAAAPGAAAPDVGTQALPRHFVAVSTNTSAVREFGIDPENMFPFWDWVGGRYSVWSAIGLPVALAVGFDRFSEFLGGAHAMDTHFRTAPLESNMPVILGLIGVWYRNFFDFPSISIAPYHQDLGAFPAYLQQLDMESNGKRVALDGSSLTAATGPLVWGDVGTNGQHAYFQLLHQGTDVTPVDFIAALKPAHGLEGHHQVLLANCFAQAEAFMKGKTADEVRAELRAQNLAADEVEVLLPHRVFPGNRPSNTLLMDALTPAALGALIALYEHKTFVQGALWGINSFDQWGVELGKMLAKQIESELGGAPRPDAHDSSTNALIARARAAAQGA